MQKLGTLLILAFLVGFAFVTPSFASSVVNSDFELDAGWTGGFVYSTVYHVSGLRSAYFGYGSNCSSGSELNSSTFVYTATNILVGFYARSDSASPLLSISLDGDTSASFTYSVVPGGSWKHYEVQIDTNGVDLSAPVHVHFNAGDCGIMVYLDDVTINTPFPTRSYMPLVVASSSGFTNTVGFLVDAASVYVVSVPGGRFILDYRMSFGQVLLCLVAVLALSVYTFSVVLSVIQRR